MILGNISSLEQERRLGNTIFVEAIEEMMKIINSDPKPGRYEIRGDLIYCNVMELDVKDPSEQIAEKHEEYIDLHYLIEGREVLGWSPFDERVEPTQMYDREGDYSLYAASEEEVMMELKPGMYIIFFPHDIHRPGMGTSGRIRKAVLKIHKNLLNNK